MPRKSWQDMTPEEREETRRKKQERFRRDWETKTVHTVQNTDTTRLEIQTFKHREGERESQISIAKFIEGERYTGFKSATAFTFESTEEVVYGILKAANSLDEGYGDGILTEVERRLKEDADARSGS